MCKPALFRWVDSLPGCDRSYRSPLLGSSFLHAAAQTLWALDAAMGEVFADLIASRETDINGKNQQGESPLHVAVLADNSVAVGMLLSAGCFTNVVTRKGETELHYAVMTGNAKTVGKLLQAGSDPSIRNGHGETPVSLAAVSGALEVWQQLDHHGRRSGSIPTDAQRTPSAHGARGGDGAQQPNMVVLTVEKANLYRPPGVNPYDSLPSTYCVVRHKLRDTQRTDRSAAA